MKDPTPHGKFGQLAQSNSVYRPLKSGLQCWKMGSRNGRKYNIITWNFISL